jgi:hypothetical protein
MTNGNVGEGSGTFDFGRVIQRAFSSIKQNWQIFFGGSALLLGVPSALAAWGQMGTMSNAMSGMSGSMLSGLAWFIGAILCVIGSYLLQAMVLKAAINGFSGKSTTFSSAFEVGARMALPLLGLAIVAGLGMMVGLILLIVPGIFLAVLWLVAAPVLVTEKRDIMESLKRSADLTRGHRWAIFGLLVIYAVIWWLTTFVVGLIGGAVGVALSGGEPSVTVVLLRPVINVVSAVLASAGIASVYYELRTAKEGVGADELAAVFD